jgi:ribonuclease J
MVSITAYGGVREIGGNKILLEDEDRKIFLDFGFPFGTQKLYYEEYLQPRGGAGLLDPLAMGLLPPLEGIYRDDLYQSEMWHSYKEHPEYRKLKGVNGVLLSHAHVDHTGHIGFLNENMPVYSTAMTAFIVKAIQDTGAVGLNSQICYYGPVEHKKLDDWKQSAFYSASGPKQQRKFNIELKSLHDKAQEFWESGFWEKGPREKIINSCAMGTYNECPFSLQCYPVDHSIPGACAWAIETSAGWVIYSGDLRLHGKRRESTEKFIEEAAKLNPVALIIEGTNVTKTGNISEQEVREKGLNAIKGVKGLVIADFSARDTDRLLTFLDIARKTNRKLAILPKDAYLLKTIRLIEPETPDISTDENIVIYQKTTSSKSTDRWIKNLFSENNNKTVLAGDVRKNQDEYILSFSFFDVNELPSIQPQKGSRYVFSSSEPHDEEQEIDFKRLNNWLEHFGMDSYGLPRVKNGGLITPEDEMGIHASGHACGTDLFEIVSRINPDMLIPVHSLHPDEYKNKLENSDIKVELPDKGKSIEIKSS